MSVVWERSTASSSVVASEITCAPSMDWVERGGELIPGTKLVSVTSEVFSRSEVKGEVMGAGGEELLSGNVVETGEGEVLSAEDTEK